MTRCGGTMLRRDGEMARCSGTMVRCDGEMARCSGTLVRCDGEMARCDRVIAPSLLGISRVTVMILRSAVYRV